MAHQFVREMRQARGLPGKNALVLQLPKESGPGVLGGALASSVLRAYEEHSILQLRK
jgi:hypothetical protein